MAINLMDNEEFPREPGVPTSRVTVDKADSSYKRHKDDTVAEDRPDRKRKPSKAQMKKKAEEMNRSVCP